MSSKLTNSENLSILALSGLAICSLVLLSFEGISNKVSSDRREVSSEVVRSLSHIEWDTLGATDIDGTIFEVLRSREPDGIYIIIEHPSKDSPTTNTTLFPTPLNVVKSLGVAE